MGRINRSYLKDKFLSTKGYKRNSPDVNNPYNVIPSNQITMEDVDFPVMGIDDLGNQQLMQPGKNYTFPGNYVTEFPLHRFQSGGQKSVILNPDYDIYKAPKQGNYLLPDINRPYYTDEEGRKRSEYKMGFNIDGKETLLPTVVGGRQLTPEEAINRYRQTGLHMGQYNTPEEADYAARLRTAKYNMLQDPVRFNASMFQMGGTIGIPRVNGQVVSQGPYPLDFVRKLGSYNQSGNGVKRMPRKAIKNILDNMR